MGRSILSVDPGANGALARLTLNGAPIPGLREVIDMPSGRVDLVDVLVSLLPLEAAFVELQQAFPGQGATSTGKLMYRYGVLLGALAVLQVPTLTVVPRSWKQKLGLPAKDKQASLDRARALWPDSDRFTLKKHEGRAEAALIGYAVIRNPDLGKPAP